MLHASRLPFRPDAEAAARAPADLPGYAALLADGWFVELGPALLAGTTLTERVLARMAQSLRAPFAALGAHDVALPASEGEALVNLLVRTGCLQRDEPTIVLSLGTGFRDDVSACKGAFSLALYDRLDVVAVGRPDALPAESLLAPLLQTLDAWDVVLDVQQHENLALLVAALPSGETTTLGRLDTRSLGSDAEGRPLHALLLTLDLFGLLGLLAEQHHDARGLRWPKGLSPVDVGVLAPGGASRPLLDKLLRELEQAGVSLLLDDRPGEPAARRLQLERWGLPLRVLVGPAFEQGDLVVERRDGGTPERVAAGAFTARILALLGREAVGSWHHARALRRRVLF